MATSQERLKELTDRLEAGIAELFGSDRYMEYLRVMSQFHHYSVNNTMLIAMQKPEATLVAGYQAWEKKFKRHVKKGEKGIRIIAPAPYRQKYEQEKKDPESGQTIYRSDGEPEMEEVTVTIPRFRPSTVFDVSQTDGEPLPGIGVDELTASVENYGIFMEAIKSVSPVPIRFADIPMDAKGFYDNVKKEIVIKEGMSESQTMKTAVHETTHALLHDRDLMKEQGIEKDQMTKEVEAESVAFVTCAHFELDTSDYSFPYIAGWSSGRDTRELKSSMDTIRRTASEIIDGIEESMREQMKERQEEIEKEQDQEELQQEETEGGASGQDTSDVDKSTVLSKVFQTVELFGVPMLFANERIAEDLLPERIQHYELRGLEHDPGSPFLVEKKVFENHAGTILSAFPIHMEEGGSLRIGQELNFEGGNLTLSEYLEEMAARAPETEQGFMETMENAIGKANENLFLTGKEDRYIIYQLGRDGDGRDKMFLNLDFLTQKGMTVEAGEYHYVYSGRLSEKETLDSLYFKFNNDHPAGYTGHSLSISDMVVLIRDGEAKAFYVDTFGFSEIGGFAGQRLIEAGKQHRKEDALVTEDSLGILVDGHDGIWQTLEGKEINGEMFYLLENQEYGDTVACVMLHMDGELVSEDLWNGFDYGAMEAVKEYFDRKDIAYSPHEFPLQERFSMDTDVNEAETRVFIIRDNVTGNPYRENGEVRTYDDRAELALHLDALNGNVRNIYIKNAGYAKEHGQTDLYRFSMQENIACKDAIEKLIRKNFDGLHLDSGILTPLTERFGEERLSYVLANTLQYKEYDGRFSQSNKSWAKMIPAAFGEDLSEYQTSTDFIVETHPAILDGFVDMFRKDMKERGLELGILDGKVPDIADGADVDTGENTVEKEPQIQEKEPETEARLTFYVAECSEFPTMGEYHDQLSLPEAVEIYESIPSDRLHGVKGIGFDLDDGSIYSGSFDLMQGGLVDDEMINSIEHYRNSPLVQKALQDIREYYPDRGQGRQEKEKQEDAIQASKEPEASGSGRKESVLQALKQRQEKLRQQEEGKEQKKTQTRKGEITL